MTSTTQPKEFSVHSWAFVVATVVATIVAGYLTTWVNFPAQLQQAVIAGAALVPGAIGYARFKRARGSRVDQQAMSEGDLVRPLVFVVPIIGFALVILESVIGGLLGLASDLTVYFSDVTVEQQLAAVSVILLFEATPAFLVAAFFVTRRGAHYLGGHPFRWLLVSLLVYLITRAIIAFFTIVGSGQAQYFEPWTSALGLVLVAALLVPVCWAASISARRSHAAFVMARLFKKLAPADREVVIGLVRETIASTDPTQR